MKTQKQVLFMNGRIILRKRCLWSLAILNTALIVGIFWNARIPMMEKGLTFYPGELFTVLCSNSMTVVCFFAGYVFLVCDSPFVDNGLSSFVLRSTRKTWLRGQILTFFAVAIVYYLWILLLTCLICPISAGGFASWSEAFALAMKTPHALKIEAKLDFFHGNSSPIVGMLQSLVGMSGVSVVFGEVMFLLGLKGRKGIGILLVFLSIGLDLAKNNLVFPAWMNWISPLTVARFMGNACVTGQPCPSGLYGIVYFSFLIGILWWIIEKSIEEYDFCKEDIAA